MSRLEIKGEKNVRKGRQKQKEAARTQDPLACIQGKEEELVGKLQKRYGKSDEEILKAIDEPLQE